MGLLNMGSLSSRLKNLSDNTIKKTSPTTTRLKLLLIEYQKLTKPNVPERISNLRVIYANVHQPKVNLFSVALPNTHLHIHKCVFGYPISRNH